MSKKNLSLKKLCLIIPLLFAIPAFAQSDSLPKKVTSLQDVFLRGQLHARFRYYGMATINDGALKDYYANGVGAGLKYETADFHGFSMGIGGSFTYNLASSDLATPDPLTGQQNRYEIGLFDVSDPANKTNLFRLEELYLKYNFKAGTIKLGKQLLNTPFINPQDGRMRPTFEDGLYATFKAGSKTTIEGGYLYGISPRSTVRWYNVGQSIGYYPQGVNPDGTRSNYLNNTQSNGIGLIGLTHILLPGVTVQLWDQYADNLFNTALLQINYKHQFNNTSAVVVAAQAIRQDGLGNGGNDSAGKRYYPEHSHAWVFGGRLGYERKHWNATLNYTRITADGRYLMPREWGRDPFFTFMPRERNEGFGDVSAVMASVSHALPAARLNIDLSAGHFELPDAKNYALNKYGFPSYNQYNASVKYSFAGFLKGLDAMFLYVYKQETGDDYNNLKFVDNKVNMSLLNLIVDYKF